MYKKVRYEVKWREYDVKNCQWLWHEHYFTNCKEFKQFLNILQNDNKVNRIIKKRVEIFKGLSTFEGDL